MSEDDASIFLAELKKVNADMKVTKMYLKEREINKVLTSLLRELKIQVQVKGEEFEDWEIMELVDIALDQAERIRDDKKD